MAGCLVGLYSLVEVFCSVAEDTVLGLGVFPAVLGSGVGCFLTSEVGWLFGVFLSGLDVGLVAVLSCGIVDGCSVSIVAGSSCLSVSLSKCVFQIPSITSSSSFSCSFSSCCLSSLSSSP